MIKLQNVTLKFANTVVLDCANLSVDSGEHIALMGPSGSGKTSILRLLAQQITPTSGTVQISTEKISYMFQEPRLIPWLTAEQNVNLVLGDHKSTLPLARSWLDKVGLSDSYAKLPSALSGGMRQRVSLARALAYDGELFLMDEPLSALDEETAEQMLQLINTYTKGKTLVFVTHNTNQANAITDTIYSIKNKVPERI